MSKRNQTLPIKTKHDSGAAIYAARAAAQAQPPQETPMSKLKALLASRKFWVLVAALVAAGASYATGQVTVYQALIAVVAATSVYTAATAIEDGLKR